MEYSTLYDLAIVVLKKERVELTPETIHSKLDGVTSTRSFLKTSIILVFDDKRLARETRHW